MINKQLINPESIVVIGGSNDIKKPGGKMVKNLKDGGFKGAIYVVNPKEKQVQGFKCYSSVNDLPNIDLAILAIPAKYCVETATILTNKKNTKAFIVISAGFSEAGEEGKKTEQELVNVITQANASLIGPK